MPAFAVAAAAVWLMAGTASAAPAFSLGHATSAPLGITSLSEYALQLPDLGDVDGSQDVPQDSTDFIAPLDGVPSTGTLQPPGAVFAPDTSAHRDSLLGFPQNFSAPVETIAPLPVYSPASATSGAGKSTGPAKRPLFGLSYIALIAGLVALHIIVVSKVAK